MELSDEFLVDKFRKTKDQTLFRTLLCRYQNRIYNSAYRILGNKEEAEEIVQDTCMKVVQNISTFSNKSSFAAWIFRIAHNNCCDLIRTKQRRKQSSLVSFDTVSSAECIGEGETAYILNQNADPSPGPEQRLEMKEEGELIALKIRELPEAQRTVLVLHDIEGLPYAEIAEIVGTNIGTVRSRLHYARLKLKEMIQNYYALNSVSQSLR